MTKQAVYEEVKNLETLCQEACRFVWNHPETGGNEKESADYMRNLMKKEGISGTIHFYGCPEEELAFAGELQATLDPVVLHRDSVLYEIENMKMHQGVSSRHLCEKTPLTGSSDSGDVSFIMPMGFFTTACWPVGVAPHTWQASAAGGSSLGEKGALYAAFVLAGTAYDLYTKPEILEKIKGEFNEQQTEYAPMYFE